MFKFEFINGKKILKSNIFESKNFTHFFTTRETVVTPKGIKALEQTANENLKEISKYLGISLDSIIIPEQTHSDNIGIAKKGNIYNNTDSLIIEDSDIAILLNFADCTPVILYDKVNNIGAIAHAGWKGTAKSIVQKTVLKMKEIYKTNPNDIVAIIGPAISMKNYAVDKSVFDKIYKTMKYDYTDWYEYNIKENKYYIDLKTVNEHQLRELGVQTIDKCEYCTYDSVDVFFSYRKEQGITARHSAILKLNN